MKTSYDQSHELSITARHFGGTSARLCIMYAILLILFVLIVLIGSLINIQPIYLNTSETPATIEVAQLAFTSPTSIVLKSAY